MALVPGVRLGVYEIVDTLGAGGMGEVYRARDTRLGRLVAVKVLRSDLAREVGSRERFEEEARAVSRLNHRTSARSMTSAATAPVLAEARSISS